MRSLKLILVLLLMVVAHTATLQAQDIQFTVRASRTSVPLDEAFQVTFTTNTGEGRFALPKLNDFRVLSGPSSSSFSSQMYNNGVLTQSVSSSWTVLLRAQRQGDLVIPPATLTVKGKTYKTEPLRITVTAAQNPVNDEGQASGNQKPVFAVISLNKTKVAQGEHLVATYKLYTIYNRILDYNIQIPIQSGVWAQEIEPGNKGWNSYVENVNGRDYAVAVIKKELLYPNTFGKLTLKPFDLMVVAQENFYESRRFNLLSNSPVIEVSALPANSPTGFSGAVGSFKLESALSKTELKVNDGLDLTLTLSGNGNFKLIDKLPIQVSSEWELYDPEVKSRLTVTENGTSGSKEFRYLLIPRRAGNYTLGPFRIAYFDTGTRSYKTLETPAYTIKVERGEGEPLAGGSQSSEVEILSREIRHLKKYTDDIRPQHDYFFGSPLFFGLLSLAPFIFLTLVVVRKKQQRSDDQLAAEKVKKAGRVAQKHLQVAREKIQQQESLAFYTETLKAIQRYLGDKLQLDAASLSKENIRMRLQAKNVPDSTADELLQLLETCEMARFGLLQSGREQEVYDRTAALIDQLENQLV